MGLDEPDGPVRALVDQDIVGLGRAEPVIVNFWSRGIARYVSPGFGSG
jgi:hypothetical protein